MHWNWKMTVFVFEWIVFGWDLSLCLLCSVVSCFLLSYCNAFKCLAHLSSIFRIPREIKGGM